MKRTRKIQGEILSAMWMRVMGDQDDAVDAIRHVGFFCQRVSGGLQVGIPVPQVGFQMCPFRPFIPGVNKDQSLIRIVVTAAAIFDSMAKPFHIVLRGAVQKDGAPTRFSSRVIPRWADSTKEGVAGVSVMTRSIGENATVVNDRHIMVCNWLHQIGYHWWAGVVRWKLNRCIEAEALWRYGVKGL